LKQIGVSEEGIAKARNSVAKKTLLLLIELLAEPEIREGFQRLREMFVKIQRSNEILALHKLLHDDLQDIQLSTSQLRVIRPQKLRHKKTGGGSGAHVRLQCAGGEVAEPRRERYRSSS
jgi:hypothetical protein